MNTHNILLVEDDANDIFFMRNAMKIAGLTEELHVAVAVEQQRQEQ